MTDPFSCSQASRKLGEPCYATASQVRRWILVEQPGAWGRDAVRQSALDAGAAEGLRRVATAAGARLLLIRRYGRSAPARRVCFAVASTRAVRRAERFWFQDPGELLELDWSPLRTFQPLGGEAVDGPLYLVCTNGAHDACCARFGRPVARVLDEMLGEAVWEASHFGGDRFAGSVVCLPEGIYYGRVDPGNARRLVEEHHAGRVALDHYRGRSFLPFVAQAAEQFVREERGLTGIADVLPRSLTRLPDGSWRVVVDVPEGDQLTVGIERTEAAAGQVLTCRSEVTEHPPRYRLLAMS